MKTVTLRLLMSTTAVIATLASGTGPALARETSAPLPKLTARAQTEASATGQVAAGVVVLDGATTRVVGAGALGGLEVYDAAGARQGATPAGESGGVDAVPSNRAPRSSDARRRWRATG